MKKVHNYKNIKFFSKISVTVFVVAFFILLTPFFLNNKNVYATTVISSKPNDVLYQGKVYNIFFHSLIVYPQLAFDGSANSSLFKKYMITRDEFNKILQELYNKNYILIDINLIYTQNKDGSLVKKDIYIPSGKKPLIISIDDLSYYKSMQGHGFASKLVIDKNGDVATEIVTPEGKTEVTRDGDIVPILDDFVKTHPDFSLNGAKGIIALTGSEGVLGYRTEISTSINYYSEVQSAENVIKRLKMTGWEFASHSYSHDRSFSNGTISLITLKKDAELWDKEVRPLVGDTNIFVGPYGEIFRHNDPRQTYLISKGFKIFYGVGMDLYTHFSPDCLEMNRADIDQFRITHESSLLNIFFNSKMVS